MSNSSLVDYKKISPNKNSPRNHKIDTITIHCVVGQCSVETLGSIFSKSSKGASSNYGIGPDGRIGMYVEEKDRSWCSSNADNDNRAITIEVASDTKEPYAVTDAAYKSLIELLVDICKRNNIKELKWRGDSSLIGQVDKQNMTVHRWFATYKTCPGTYLYERHGAIAEAVNKKLNGGTKTSTNILYRVQAGAFSKKDYAKNVLKEIKKIGYKNAIVARSGDLYKVYVDTYKTRAEAEKVVKKLDDEDFSACVITLSVKSNTKTTTKTTTPKKSVDTIAKEVLAGKWGNGSERKEKLTKAGYDYKAVQKRVNELL